MFLDIAVSFAAIAVCVIAGISYIAHRKIQYKKLHPPAPSDRERLMRRYELTGDGKVLQQMLELEEVQN